MDGHGVVVEGSGGGREVVVYMLWGASWRMAEMEK